MPEVFHMEIFLPILEMLSFPVEESLSFSAVVISLNIS